MSARRRKPPVKACGHLPHVQQFLLIAGPQAQGFNPSLRAENTSQDTLQLELILLASLNFK